MPIIFASSLMLFPGVLFGWLDNTVFAGHNRFISFMNDEFKRGSYIYILTELVMIYFFAYFWTTVQFQPKEMANQLRDYGSFIPGLRPGKRTSDYLEKVMMRITYVAAVAPVRYRGDPNSPSTPRSGIDYPHYSISRWHRAAHRRQRGAGHGAADRSQSGDAELRRVFLWTLNPRESVSKGTTILNRGPWSPEVTMLGDDSRAWIDIIRFHSPIVPCDLKTRLFDRSSCHADCHAAARLCVRSRQVLILGRCWQCDCRLAFRRRNWMTWPPLNWHKVGGVGLSLKLPDLSRRRRFSGRDLHQRER